MCTINLHFLIFQGQVEPNPNHFHPFSSPVCVLKKAPKQGMVAISGLIAVMWGYFCVITEKYP